MSAATFTILPIEKFKESALNPRKHYEPIALQELAESLKASGQLEPVLVRPVNGHYELLSGHRRFRAAKLVGITQLEAKVQDVDDKTAIEILTISNLQRDDLHPLEEAQGFADLIKHAGYDVAKIAARIGRSENYVYDRVKLLQLIPVAKKLFSEGVMEAGHAILLARLTPDQQKATVGDTKALGEGYHLDGGLFRNQHGHPIGEESLPLNDKIKAVSVRELARFIDDTFRAAPERIDPVLFPQTVATLAEAADMHTKVVHITRDYRTSDATRDEKIRTFGREAWKRADGLADPSDEDRNGQRSGKPEKAVTCSHWVIGLVVSGPGREEAFKVCVAKEKCHIHWPEQAKAAERRKKAVKKDVKVGGTKNQEKAAEKEKREEQESAEKLKQEQAERARWKKAVPELMEALATAVGKLSAKARAEILIGFVEPEVWQTFPRQLAKHMPTGDAVASAVFLILTRDMGEWSLDEEVATALRDVGVKDAVAVATAIVDKVAPPVAKTKTPDVRKPAKSPKAKKAKVKK